MNFLQGPGSRMKRGMLKCDRFLRRGGPTSSPRMRSSQTGRDKIGQNDGKLRVQKVLRKDCTQGVDAGSDLPSKTESNQCDAEGVSNTPHTSCDGNECASYWVVWFVAVVFLLMLITP